METLREGAIMFANQFVLPRRRKLDLESQIARLNKIGIALSSEHNLDRLLDMIVREARRFTNADGGSLYIREGDRLHFHVAQTESLERRNGRHREFQSFYLPLTKESIGGYVAITGHTVNLEDAYDIPTTVEYRLNKEFDLRFGYRTKSMLVVPMRDHEDEIIGVLQLINSIDEYGTIVPFEEEYETLILSLASQAAVAIRNAKLIKDIRNVFRALVRYSAKAIDARSPHTAGHSGRVATYSVRIMEAINEERTGPFAHLHYTPQEIEEMRMAGWLHDIGKIGVSEAVLDKKNKLTEAQIEAIENRFKLIGAIERVQSQQQKFELAQQGRLSPEKSQELDETVSAAIAQLQRDLDFIKFINRPGNIRRSDLRRLHDLAHKAYLDFDGEHKPFLTPHELEHLRVLKGNLTKAEFEEVKSHVTQTISILENIPFTKDLENIPKYAAAHHEKLDGSGYPYGLMGEEISLCGRIMAVCDIFDALTASDRPYKKAFTVEESLAILRKEAEEGKLDKNVVNLFIDKRLYERRARSEEDDD